jgi:cell surface protein SprA
VFRHLGAGTRWRGCIDEYSRKGTLFAKRGEPSLHVHLQARMLISLENAYSGKSTSEVSLNPFKTSAQPNWKVSYDGLTKLESVKKYFKQFNVTHNYRSTATASYVSNLKYEEFNNLPTAIDQSEEQNFISQHQIGTVTLTESYCGYS